MEREEVEIKLKQIEEDIRKHDDIKNSYIVKK
jgi:hypothetical protein